MKTSYQGSQGFKIFKKYGVYTNGRMEPIHKVFSFFGFELWKVVYPDRDTDGVRIHKKEILDELSNYFNIEMQYHCDEPEKPIFLSAFSKVDGAYVGIIESAYSYHQKGIRNIQKAEKKNNVASIGELPEQNRWVGWSHRAMCSFGVGSTCEKGDCHYIPETFEEIRDTYYFGEPCHLKEEDKCIANASHKTRSPTKKEIDSGDRLEGEIVCLNEWAIEPCECSVENCIFPTGSGEWIAETIGDAKQMAIDFADGVG